MQTLTAFETHTWSSEMGDYIGTESCVDLQQQTEEAVVDGGWRRCCRNFDRRSVARRVKKEYPPPISSPWVLKRYYTNDGRLIIMEENMGHYEFFKVHRANGRLTLQLVPRNEEIVVDVMDETEDDDVEYHSNLDQDGCDVVGCEDVTVDASDDSSTKTREDRTVEIVVSVPMKVERERPLIVGIGGEGGGEKFYNFNSVVIPSPCMFGIPVVPAAIGPVHI